MKGITPAMHRSISAISTSGLQSLKLQSASAVVHFKLPLSRDCLAAAWPSMPNQVEFPPLCGSPWSLETCTLSGWCLAKNILEENNIMNLIACPSHLHCFVIKSKAIELGIAIQHDDSPWRMPGHPALTNSPEAKGQWNMNTL